MSARRILFLTPRPPRLDGTSGGQRVMAQTIAGLARRHRIALLALRRPGEPAVDAALRAACEFCEEVELRGGRPAGCRPAPRRHRLSRLFHRPGGVLQVRAQAFGDRVRDLAASWRPDIVQFEYHLMGQYEPALDGCVAGRVLTEYEPGITAARDRIEARTGLARVRARLETETWTRYERRVIQRMDAVIVFTERDRAALAPLAGSTPIVPIPFGTNPPPFPLDPVGRNPLTLLFIGNFGHPPNAEAAIRLVHTILPRVHRWCPEAMVEIVGASPPPRVQRLAGQKVHVTGPVADITPYLDRAAIVAAPLDRGGGMRVKVTEALAAGKAVVATPLAAEGTGAVDGEHLRLADSDEQFASAIVELLASPERRRSLAVHARAWAGESLGWEHSLAAREALYEQILSERRGADVPGAARQLRMCRP